MRRGVLLLVVVLSVFLSTGAAAAQSVPAGGNSTGTESAAPTPNGERIDNSTVLLNSSWDNETGMVTVTIKSETIQEITLSDAGAFVEGGVVNQRTVSLAPGETATISLSATRTDSGFVGVSIATDDVLYAEPIQQGEGGASGMFEGTPGWGTVRIAAIGSGLGVLVALGGEAYRRRNGGRKEVRQRA